MSYLFDECLEYIIDVDPLLLTLTAFLSRNVGDTTASFTLQTQLQVKLPPPKSDTRSKHMYLTNKKKHHFYTPY